MFTDTLPNVKHPPDNEVQIAINNETIACTTTAAKIKDDEYVYKGTFNIGVKRHTHITSVQLLHLNRILCDRTINKQTNQPLNEYIGDYKQVKLVIKWKIKWGPQMKHCGEEFYSKGVHITCREGGAQCDECFEADEQKVTRELRDRAEKAEAFLESLREQPASAILRKVWGYLNSEEVES